MTAAQIVNATAARPPQQASEGPAEHCRNALALLDALQELLLDDPRGLPLTDALQLLWAAENRMWQSVWLLEPPRRGDGNLLSSTGAEIRALSATAQFTAGRHSGEQP